MTSDRPSRLVRAFVVFVVVGGMSLSGCGWPTEHCRDVQLTREFVEALRSNAAATDLSITSLGVVDPDAGCDFSSLNVERSSDVAAFLDAVDISAVDEAEGEAVVRDRVRRWQRITDNAEHDDRAVKIEQALSKVDGLDQAVIKAGCSETEYTCMFSVAVDGWFFFAQNLYFGLIVKLREGGSDR